jgi:signal transduction histidine kinase
MGHSRRCASTQVRTRFASHAPGSQPHATVQSTQQRASGTRAEVLQERARIARELHDGVSQTLYAIIIGVSRARSLVGDSEGAMLQCIIDDVLHLATSGQDELRALLTDIRSDFLMSGSVLSALEDLATEARTRNGFDVRVSFASEPELAAAAKNALVMIVREALQNAARHSAARCVDVVLERDGDNVVLLVNDDGCGFDTTRPRPGHFGLQSMRERATEIGGTLLVTSGIGRGTQLRVSIPVSVSAYG